MKYFIKRFLTLHPIVFLMVIIAPVAFANLTTYDEALLDTLLGAIDSDRDGAITDESWYANLVTNGDSHDHSGGDGAQIDHTGLSNIGTNTHAQVDTHLAAANPHSGSQADLDVPSQAEAEAGTATTERVWTAQRVGQAIAALAGGGTDDQTAAEVPNTPAGNIAATDVQAAVNELDTEKQVDLDVPSQAEAEAGTATTERVWTAQRVAQAIAALAGGGTDEIVYQADCSTITNGFCIRTADDYLYYYDGDEVVQLYPVSNFEPTANPTLGFKDSNAPGTDKDVGTIQMEYVDGGDGAENADMFFYTWQGGIKTLLAQFDESDDRWEFTKDIYINGAAVITSGFYAYDHIPIAWAKDGTSAPDAIDDGVTRSPYAYRTFDSTADEDVNFMWLVPHDLSGTTIQFRVHYLITAATGPTATEGVAFGLSGVSNGDNDATNGTKGTVVVVTDDTLNSAQWDTMITDWSGSVTITDLLAGENAELAFIRDVSDTVDDYGQVVGVFRIDIRYVKNPA